jgi:putative SOS response-associated peptidase YedK
MCGRFSLYIPKETLAKTFQLVDAPEYDPSYNIAPTNDVPVIGRNSESGDLSASLLRWGLIPHWVDDPNDFSAQLINARLETVEEKSSFKRSFRNRRCLVPANGFYEWRQNGDQKTPYYIHPTGDDLFRFAGLWDLWTDESSGKAISSFTILTREATEQLVDIHERMPVLLNSDQQETWLDDHLEDVSTLKEIAHTGSREIPLDYHEVSSAVNNPSYDNEDCIESVSK